MNECWGVETKSFNNYVAFDLTNSNALWKINGNDPVNQTKADPKTWTSFDDFKTFYKVCELINNPPPPPPTVTADFYRSDSCSSNLMGTVSFTTDAASNENKCSQFANSQSSQVWGVKINGTCYDFMDMSALEACRRSQANPTAASTVTMYRSDSCSSNVLGFYSYNGVSDLDAYCNRITSGSSSSVWGIRVGNQTCSDIFDSPIASACYMFRYAGDTVPSGGNAVDYYRSDSCNGSYLGRMIFTSDAARNDAACAKIAPFVSPQIWGIRRGGASCENISDTSYANACANFR